jgi:ATP-dependent Clp protease ATP-binding subunit ClpC
MFERFTEKARRVIFFGRFEASQFGSPLIGTEHLLLGLLREDKGLTRRFLRVGGLDGIRKEIEQHTTVRQSVSTSVDLPLSNESKRVLHYASEEADQLEHKHIGTEHLLLGVLREENCFAAKLLTDRGIRLEALREELTRAPHATLPSEVSREPSRPAQASANLIRLEPLHPLVGRESELDRIIHILGCFNAKNPVLVGELGVGKRTIVGGLAQRIADGAVPAFLADKAVVELDLPPWGAIGSAWFERFHSALPKAAEEGAILFVDELHTPVNGAFGAISIRFQEILKRAVVSGQLQCISVATPAGYAKSIADHGWLEGCFQPIQVRPASEADCIQVVRGIKQVYEEFHGVTYAEEALTGAVAYASACIPERHLPGKAVDVLDEAASCARLRHATLPEDVIELQKRIRFIAHRMASAIENHEFEKARFYSDEERKERANLDLLRKEYKLKETGALVEVTLEDIEGVVARWTGATLDAIRKFRPPAGGGSKEKDS